MSTSEDRLYELLPAVYRLRDATEGMPLRDLLRVMTTQVNLVEADIAQLYENWFIETCEDWVVPYLADLIGYQPVHEAGEPSDLTTLQGRQRNRILIPRREVANTIRYRRRKGTLALLELLANDVAGWPARAVEFYQLLGWTQHLDRQHLDRGRTVNLRRGNALERLNTPFDELAHTIDIRRITSQHDPGYYNLPAVGLFVWRLKVYPVTKTRAYCIDRKAARYTFSILSNATPLYTLPQVETDPTQIAGELNLPIPIRRQAFAAHQEDYYGPDKSLQIWRADARQVGKSEQIVREPVPVEKIVVANLTHWRYHFDDNNDNEGLIAVDPVLGRILFSANQAAPKGVWVSYHYGFSDNVGGGEYDRTLLEPAPYRLLDAHDLNNAASLIHKLKQTPTDPVSTYLQENLSDSTRDLLTTFDPDSLSEPVLEAVLEAILSDLNQLIQRESLYTPQRFAQITLSAETYALITQNPQGKQLIHLNRLLLEQTYPQEVAKYSVRYPVGEQGRIGDALTQWQQDNPRHGVIEITQSSVHVEQIEIELPANRHLTIRAANRTRPIIRQLDWKTDQPDAVSVRGGAGSSFTLDGLLISGRGVHAEGDLAELTIRHCTLVPGWQIGPHCEPETETDPSLDLSNVPAKVVVDHSILGTIQVKENEIHTDPIPLSISDSIVDATATNLEAIAAPSAPVAHVMLTITRSTVLGQVQVHAIQLAENSIFTGEVLVARRQVGCMRFCYSPPDPRTLRYKTPRRFHCQPDLAEQAVDQMIDRAVEQAIAKGIQPNSTGIQTEKERLKQVERDRVRPQFNSIRYGNPTYCQLSHACAEEIQRGADDESEMGVFHDLYQPQRSANLRARLNEYTPAGMETGIIYAD